MPDFVNEAGKKRLAGAGAARVAKIAGQNHSRSDDRNESVGWSAQRGRSAKAQYPRRQVVKHDLSAGCPRLIRGDIRYPAKTDPQIGCRNAVPHGEGLPDLPYERLIAVRRR